jgi:hypothetical protein
MRDAFDMDVVSAQFPCGAAWLANAMLELQLPLRQLWGFDTSNEWTIVKPGLWRYSAEHLPWRQTLASLRMGREFRFRDDLHPRFSHAFPWQLDMCPKVVLMVRDPRDALHSEWRRHLQNNGLAANTGFVEFLRQPFNGGPISNIDMLWLHCCSWIAVLQSNSNAVYLLRFEDWKRRPVRSLGDVCQWIGLPTSPAELASAAQASEVSHLQRIESDLLAANPLSRQFNRAGLVEEWRSVWQSQWNAAWGSHWQPILDALGYPAIESEVAVQPSFCLDQVLEWRGLKDPDLLVYWKEVLTTPKSTCSTR